MTSKLDPQELERLSKAATQARRAYELEPSGSTLAALLEHEKRFAYAVADLFRTGQLVPAQPSGDVVEAVALTMINRQRALNDYEPLQDLSALSDEDQEFWREEARSAITTYEAVSGVAKMRESLRAVNDAETPSSWEAAVDELIEAARAALGEKP